MVQLLHYRPWRGELHSPAWSVPAIARAALEMVLGRRLFWGLYALSLLAFLFFFFGMYLISWAKMQTSGQKVALGPMMVEPEVILGIFQKLLQLDGDAETFRNFFHYQGWMVMVLLAMAGTVLVGNDFQYNSLPFYLSKPLAPRHYLLGKCLAVGVVVNLMTTLPAVLLFVQARVLYGWNNFAADFGLLGGILAYGTLLTVFFSLMLVAAACWLRRPVPLIMVWTTLFLFARLLGNMLVDGLGYSPWWRLLDLWNDTYILGNLCLGLDPDQLTNMPSWPLAALVLGALCILCLIYLNRRVRAVEIVR
jgi:ABC-type transport system involved in multi-copper enzyme maturation permease subunit